MNPPKDERRYSTQELRDQLADAVVIALKRTADDPEFSKAFWQRGYVELASHAGNASSQWIGKKIAVWAATAALGWLIVYLVRQGAIK